MRTEEEREKPSSLKLPSEVKPETQGSPDLPSCRGMSQPPLPAQPHRAVLAGGQKHCGLPCPQHPPSNAVHTPDPISCRVGAN